MEPLDTQSLPFSIEVSRGRFRNSRSKRPQRNETNSRNEDAKEILPENRSRQGPEIGANPDGSGRGKIPGFGGRQNLVTFQLKSCLKFDDFGSEQAPGPFGGFSGSKTGRPEGRPERPPRRPTTPSKSTRSSRLCSVSLSSVLFRLVLLRDVVVSKISFASKGRSSFFLVSSGRIRKFHSDLWTFSPDPVTSSVVAAVER